MRGILAFMAVFVLSGCCPLRDMTVYQTELDFADLMVNRQAPTVRSFLDASCTCSDGTWTSTGAVSNAECENAADWYMTYSARWAWHTNMARYNGGIIEEDPGEAPVIPETCEFPEVSHE